MSNTIEFVNKPAAPSAAGARLSCLVVEDSPTVRRIARKFITEMGYEVEEAESGIAALGSCRERLPDLILLDWNMPEMNGLEFLIKLRAMEDGNCPAVVFCTTESDVDHIRKAIEAGADEYIVKPFDRASLKAKLVSATDRRRK